jgi:SPOR domain/Transglycosylase SLT domain
VAAALNASASYLRDLRNRFGNLGLAAAAYNAGPQRVQDWLSAQGGLPKETRHYVKVVTGRPVEEWSRATAEVSLAFRDPMPCTDLDRTPKYPAATRVVTGAENVSQNDAQQSKLTWGVQLIGSPSQALALASFQQLQRTYKNLLETLQPFVVQTKVGTSGFWYRVRVVTDTRSEAESLCTSLRAAGGSCLVQRN